jgi:hypothetical protein
LRLAADGGLLLTHPVPVRIGRRPVHSVISHRTARSRSAARSSEPA